MLVACGKRSADSKTGQKATHPDMLAVHANAILIDSHNDVTSETLKGLDLGVRRDKGHTDLPRLKEGGVDAVFFAAYVSADYAKKGGAAKRALEMIDTIRYDIVAKHPSDVVLATAADDIIDAGNEGKMAALIGIEGGHAIEDDLRILRDFYALGTRYMTLTHANTNNWADSSGDMDKPEVKHHNGLTDFGKQVVLEMNRLGMMVDISHVSDKTFWDVIAVSQVPPFASHSSARAISNIPRNMSDDMIKALAKKGGVIQINFGCEFLSQKSADASPFSNPGLKAKINALPEASRKKAAAEIEAKIPRATLADAVAHIEHVKEIVGVDYIGIGSDFDGVGCVPVGLDDVSKFPNLTRALMEKGYSADDIAKIYGGNLLRVMRQVEKAAAQ
jgi:membrane dipeptidase